MSGSPNCAFCMVNSCAYLRIPPYSNFYHSTSDIAVVGLGRESNSQPLQRRVEVLRVCHGLTLQIYRVALLLK